MKKSVLFLLVLFTGVLSLVPAAGKKEKNRFDLPEMESNNLVLNASFENNTQGWEPLWTREEKAGNARIISGKGFEGKKALEITYDGTQDWSFGQVRRVAVSPGEVYEISALALCSHLDGAVQISVVTRTEDNKVLSWMHGLSETHTAGKWVHLHSRFLIPPACTNIQFRITGRGPVKTRLDRIVLLKLKDTPDPVLFKKNEYTISAGKTSVSFFPADSTLVFSQSGISHTFHSNGLGEGLILTGFSADENLLKFSFCNAESDEIDAVFSIHADGPENSAGTIEAEISGTGALNNPVMFPGLFQAAEQDFWIIPQNEGLLVPAMDPYYRPWDLQLFQGHGGLSMPFIGLTDGNEGLLIMAETPDDAIVRYREPDRPALKGSGFSFIWLPQKGQWGYARKLRLVFVSQGGHTGIARAYREIAREQGKLVTLAEKQKRVPAVERLAGAADIWWWQKAEWWQDDPEGWKAARELKKAGIEKALWSNANSAEEIKQINRLGYLSGKYDIYQDVWSPKVPIHYGNREGWPEDLILLADGTYMKGWVAKENGKEYPGGVICSSRAVERMKENVSDVLKKLPYLARFIDTTTASPLRECYNPDHSLTRTEDRRNKQDMLGLLGSRFGLVAGSETGIDWAVPYLDYFEGMMSIGPYRFDDAGYDLTSYKPPTEKMLRFQTGSYYRIPLFELVYHDCIVSYWYWGDSSNRLPELWRDRDLFNLLYGTGPLYILDRQRWEEDRERIVESYKTATLTASHTAYAEMRAHYFLADDHSIQYSEFADGTRVWVNFGHAVHITEDGYTLPAKGYFVVPGNSAASAEENNANE
ncbi:MAG: carbohydrate binding domain-containing protein [Spirochaetales bacterium]|nr:carbohydrate binding domain-containing protein [Spirochaetales bacterium]